MNGSELGFGGFGGPFWGSGGSRQTFGGSVELSFGGVKNTSNEAVSGSRGVNDSENRRLGGGTKVESTIFYSIFAHF